MAFFNLFTICFFCTKFNSHRLQSLTVLCLLPVAFPTILLPCKMEMKAFCWYVSLADGLQHSNCFHLCTRGIANKYHSCLFSCLIIKQSPIHLYTLYPLATQSIFSAHCANHFNDMKYVPF